MHTDFPEYFNGSFLKKNETFYRHYQYNIFLQCKNKNSLVVLPTGLGKTIIGILLIANSLKKYSKGKVIILAPTKPLVSQHEASCIKFLDIKEDKITSMTGKTPPEKRILRFNKSRIVISTPQVIKNDLQRGRYDLNRVSLIIFDEAHRTKGNYAYNFISNEYINSCTDPLILGLTASPGKDYNYIQQICDNLYIENVVFKHYSDYDVKEYIHDVDIFLQRVELPVKLVELSEIWNHLFKQFLRFFIDRNLINPFKKNYSKLDFLRLSYDLTLSLRYENCKDKEIEEKDYLNCLFYQSPRIIDVVKEKRLNIHSIFSYCSSCISILHGKDLLETQDITLFNSFLKKIEAKAEQNILSAKRIVKSKHFKFINSMIEKDGILKLSHPKICKLISIINEEEVEFHNKKIIIFTQYREMAEGLKNRLKNKLSNSIKIEKFIGQMNKYDDLGYSQNKQMEILQDFRDDRINILIATSVAEEGLDIPNVDAIIFYEPVPSEIRLIQRRGRTGRYAPGRCYILITEGTVDVPFYIIACKKENTMNSVLLDSEQLKLNKELKRKKIKFSKGITPYSGLDFIRNFEERRAREKELLASLAIEEIITQLDGFSRSKDYLKFKNYGVSFFSDLVKVDKLKLRNEVLKMKGKKNSSPKQPKRYLNRNVKALINIANTYGNNEIIDFSEFQKLAEEEDILDRKFRIHLNQACYLGYLKRETHDKIRFIKDYRE